MKHINSNSNCGEFGNKPAVSFFNSKVPSSAEIRTTQAREARQNTLSIIRGSLIAIVLIASASYGFNKFIDLQIVQNEQAVEVNNEIHKN